MKIEIKIPDIGDFKDVPVIELLVAAGDDVEVETPLLILESDKATLDVPSPAAGRIAELLVKIGDRVSQGSVVAIIEARAEAKAPPAAERAPAAPPAPTPVLARGGEKGDLHTDLFVIGGGPGGYTAAFRAADLGKKVILADRRAALGGVCLNVGCIPSKALLHAAKIIDEAAVFSEHGVRFGAPKVDIEGLRAWKDGVVGRLTQGLSGLALRRGVTVLEGVASFASPNLANVKTAEGTIAVSFDQAVIAVGSEPTSLPFLPAGDQRIIDSTGALALAGIPKRLLVLGGGIIGLEMATVYHALGAAVTIVEMQDQIIPGADRDVVAPLMKRIERRYDGVHLNTKLHALESQSDGLRARWEGPGGSASAVFDQVLVAVGRTPNGAHLNAAAAGVHVETSGFIGVDAQMRTNVSHIFAIGDVVGQPMLAHKATHEAKVAAEVAAGHNAAFDARVIPSVAYTDPEIAWVGVTEREAKAKGLEIGKGAFPWAASGRALSLGRDDGFTKLIFDKGDRRVLGAAIVGPNAGELIAEAALAIEMGADATDLALTIHPHPTLSETIGLSAEAFEGTLTDLKL